MRGSDTAGGERLQCRRIGGQTQRAGQGGRWGEGERCGASQGVAQAVCQRLSRGCPFSHLETSGSTTRSETAGEWQLGTTHGGQLGMASRAGATSAACSCLGHHNIWGNVAPCSCIFCVSIVIALSSWSYTGLNLSSAIPGISITSSPLPVFKVTH